MKYVLKEEFKRAFLNKKFILLVILGLLIHIYSLFVWEHGVIFFDYSAEDIVLDAAIEGITKSINRYTFWYHGMDIYIIIMPLLACIPYSASLCGDKESNFYTYIVTRTKKKDYFISKIFINGLIGGVILALPTLLFYLLLTFIVPGPIIYFRVHPIGFLSELFMSNPNLYILFTILIEFLFGFTYSTFALAISKFNVNKVFILLTPFIYWYVGTFIFERLKFFAISPASFNAFMVRGFSNIYMILGQSVAIMTISILIILYKNGDA
ncbi:MULTISPECIES: hypothetical protein [unclassified Clostridium]|uniref:hypothetical protein n=1 Tax=unclassified Clostridium TaxID=2614128 RepID=UPI002A80CEF2|nr:hypothetical protein [Clostridium sp.]MDY4251878.1 hypothetical protein [Clostridium sp.]